MLKFRLLAISVVIVAASLSISVFQYYNEDTSDFEAARESSTEQYLQLEPGSTRYQVFGNESSPTVVLVHSFNGFLESWAPNIESLVKAGYRVLTYDLWGRGLSARPRIDLSLPVFRRQLNALIKHLGANKVHLVGSSFGCVIASDYTLHNPSRVEKLVLIGPAGWPSEGDNTNRLLNIPILGDFVFHYFGESILKTKVEAYLYNKEAHYWAVEEWERFAAYPGFTRSALSTLRHSPVLDYTEGWRKLGALGKPTLFIWGKQDVSFPFANTEKVATLIPHAEIVGVEDAAHWVNIEKPLQTNEAVVSFLAQ
jgi:pimeloyl-ACP methyl ester carboxylesterase